MDTFHNFALSHKSAVSESTHTDELYVFSVDPASPHFTSTTHDCAAELQNLLKELYECGLFNIIVFLKSSEVFQMLGQSFYSFIYVGIHTQLTKIKGAL